MTLSKSMAAPARIRRSRRDDRSCHRFAVGVMNEPSWGIKLTCRVPLSGRLAFPPHRSAPSSSAFFDRDTGTQQSRSGSAPQKVRAPVAMSPPSLKTHTSSGRYSYPYLSKLVIAPVKLKRMVPARWMTLNDANISEASAPIAITAPELTQPQPCGR